MRSFRATYGHTSICPECRDEMIKLIYLDKNIRRLEMDYRLEFKKVNKSDDGIRVNIFNSYEQRFSISEQIYAINECSRVIVEGVFQLYLIRQTFEYGDYSDVAEYIKSYNSFYDIMERNIDSGEIFENTIISIKPNRYTLYQENGYHYDELDIKLNNSYIIVQENGIICETEFIQIELDRYLVKLQLLYDEYCNWIKNNIKDKLVLDDILEWIESMNLVNNFMETMRSTFMRYQLS